MAKQLPNFVPIKSRRAALAGGVLLTAFFAAAQAYSAPLAGAPRHLDSDLTMGGLVRVGGVTSINDRAFERRGYRHWRFRYTGRFPRYRYTVIHDGDEARDDYPQWPRYFSYRYNWYPPTATFRDIRPGYAW
jgi:hypothetical protein